jgi:predicted DNA-binding transcriptional regulator YafY
VRADRLVAILLMLQRRGKVTAAEVAAELEVSERTARRDLDALAMAGVPIYSQQGRGGGWRLAGGGRLDLSGLSAPEATALFLVAGPTASVTPEVRAALRKLVHALPEPLRDGAEAAATATVVDPTDWDRTDVADPAMLEDLRRAVIDAEQVRLVYRDRSGRLSARDVGPLGVVRKGRSWYLVAATDRGRRTFRVDRVRAAERLGRPVERPDGFDLEREWRAIEAEVDRMRTPLTARVAVRPDALGYLRATVGRRLRVLDDVTEPSGPDTGERAAAGAGTAARTVAAEVRGHSVPSLVAELAGFGDALEVLGPAELRRALGQLGLELAATYGAQVPQ